MTATQVLGFVGILLIIGFLADYLFRKTRFPDILVLLALGYLIGPVFNVVDPAKIGPALEIIAGLAVAIILFNGGLNLGFERVLSAAPRAVALVVLGIAASVASTAAFAWYFLHWEPLNSLLLGVMVGGTSPAIVMPLLGRARVPVRVSSLLELESALNGALVIVIGLVIVEIMAPGGAQLGVAAPARNIALSFLLGAGIGVAAGALWLWLLSRLEGETYDDILTIAVLLSLYFVVELINGSGIIFAISFGLILGNGSRVAELLRIERTPELHGPMVKFHSQMSFVIKTFFFFSLGLLITLDDPWVILYGVILSLILLFVRHIVVLITSTGNGLLFANRGILTTMLPRGLSAAVIATVAVEAGIPNASVYPNIISCIIVATIVISAIGVFVFVGNPLEGIQVMGQRTGDVAPPRKRAPTLPPKQVTRQMTRQVKKQVKRAPSRRTPKGKL